MKTEGKDRMESGKYKFQKLTPVDNADLGIYEEALDFIFENEDIKNVAISGAYSAGKSSVLASYKRKHDKIHFLHISLAHFNMNKDGRNSGQDTDEMILEGKILNQLIHQIPSERISQTNFKVKRRIDTKRIFRETMLVMLFILLVSYVRYFDSWKVFVNSLSDHWIKGYMLYTTNTWGIFFASLAIGGILYYAVYALIKLQKTRSILRKLKIQENEIEILEDTNDSYFDKYLNEVLYLFENAEEDVVVFEDMDRFNTGLVFEHLREINTLANIQLKKEGKKPLRFFYLLRDDIFISKDRTKFFDYIVPIIPVVDGSNSYNKFLEYFRNAGLLKLFDESFLQGLSLYIDDMRLLKNIYNEFVVYYARLNTTELDPNKMLGIIAYKNLFPRDFGYLQLNQGFVATLFSHKESFIKEELKRINSQIRDIEERKTKINNECLTSEYEIDMVTMVNEGMAYSIDRYNRSQWYGLIMGRLSGERQRIYLERRDSVKEAHNGKIEELNKARAELEENILKLKDSHLAGIINRENVDLVFAENYVNEIGEENDFKDVKTNDYFPLLKYLIRNGYIDENYADYMTYFYEDSISKTDQIFLRSVADQKAKDYTYQLNNPGKILLRMKQSDFGQEEALNFTLLEYLLTSQTHESYLRKLLEQLKETSNFEFIISYFDWTKNQTVFVKNLNLCWKELFFIMTARKMMTQSQQHLYSLATLYCSTDEELKEANYLDCLCVYISKSDTYLDIREPQIQKIISGFKLLNVKFSKILYEVSNKELLMEVLNNECYELNSDNIIMILEKIFNIDDLNSIMHKNYTLIQQQPDKFLSNYIHEDMESYLNVILEMCEGLIEDEEVFALNIINMEDVSLEQKKCYVDALKTIIQSLSSVTEKALWIQLMENELISYTEDNVMLYFLGSHKLDKTLVDYINRGDQKLNFAKVEKEYTDEQLEELFESVIRCNSIRDTKYEEILVSLKYRYDDFGIAGIAKEKVNILVNTGIIKMTVDSLKYLRETYRDSLYLYIEKNLQTYLDIMDEQLFSYEEMLEILEWGITDESKKKLISFTDDPISVLNSSYSVSLRIYILQHNLMPADLKILFAEYDKYEIEFQNCILEVASKNLGIVIDEIKDVSQKLQCELIQNEKLEVNSRVELLIAMLPRLKETDLKDMFVYLKMPEYLKIFDLNTRPKFQNNVINEQLLEALKENHWIKEYQEDAKRSGFFKIVRFSKNKLSDVLL